MSLLLDCFYLLAFLVASPWIAYRLTASRGWKLMPQRLGIGLAAEPGETIWLHGSSVGEVSVLKPLVATLERELPRTRLVVSSYTQTGLEAARAAFPEHRVVAFPLDLSFVVRRFLGRLNPRLVIIVESELWPNFLLATRRHRAPTVVLNGKMSAKSFAFHARTRLIPAALRGLDLLAVQSEEHAERFRALGVPAEVVRVTGNMKFDLAKRGVDAAARANLRAVLGYAADDIVIVGGSLHSGEDAALLRAFGALGAARSHAGLMLVPRYPAEAEAVAANVAATGVAAVLKSAVDAGRRAPRGKSGVLVVDTLGELGRLYAAADIAYVGGSMFYRGANKGGHNLMEPAILGLPVLFGPYNYSFKEICEELLTVEGGVLVRNEEALGAALAMLVADGELRRAMGRRARDVVLRGQGATARNFALLHKLLTSEAGCLQPFATNRTMPQATSDADRL
jgi:3-deoxy-D-manno-octulosonic-acid transferase